MKSKFRLLSGCIIWLLLSAGSFLHGQILKDTASLRLVKEGVDHIYNMRFSKASEICEKINSLYPDHPAVFLLRGMIIYWDNYPLTETSDARSDFEDQIGKCLEKCDRFKPENEAEFLLTGLCARGIRLMFYTDNEMYTKIFAMAASTYRCVRRAFNHTSEFSDFYFYTGLYNYYREVYPAAHPMYKPVYFLFPSGDRIKGLQELQTAFERSIFLKAEASSYLSSGYKYFENDFSMASYFSKRLFNEYRQNFIYQARCIEDLLLNGKYDEAEKLIIPARSTINNRFYQAQLTIFNGIVLEKKYHDFKRAEKEYSAGAKEISSFGNYGSQYAAYAYFGLSRASALKNDRHNQKFYRRKALELTDFGNVNFDL